MARESPISFVMPAYNCADTVVESVESIIQGNFEEGDELIIVNDGSTDNTTRVLSNLKEKYPFITVIHNAQNKGCPASRNIGIGNATNPIIFNLDSDDILVPGSVRQLQQFMISEKADAAAFAERHYFVESINQVTHKWIWPVSNLTLADMLASHLIPGGNFLYTKESWREAGGYWEYGPGLNEAWGFMLKLLARGSKLVVMPGTYYFHRHGYGSLTIREWKNKGDLSLVSTKMIMPFLGLIEDNDADYITSKEGSKSWYDNLEKRPIRLKTGEAGRTGSIVVPLRIWIKTKVLRILRGILSILKTRRW